LTWPAGWRLYSKVRLPSASFQVFSGTPKRSRTSASVDTPGCNSLMRWGSQPAAASSARVAMTAAAAR